MNKKTSQHQTGNRFGFTAITPVSRGRRRRVETVEQRVVESHEVADEILGEILRSAYLEGQPLDFEAAPAVPWSSPPAPSLDAIEKFPRRSAMFDFS